MYSVEEVLRPTTGTQVLQIFEFRIRHWPAESSWTREQLLVTFSEIDLAGSLLQLLTFEL